MHNPRERIVAVVVTYNRKLLLAECLDSLVRQSHPPDAIYIVDNHSTDGTRDYLIGREWIAPGERTGMASEPTGTPQLRPASSPAEPIEPLMHVGSAGPADPRVEIRYFGMPENTGSAGGFHEGIRRAAAAGFDWLWLMDDDLLTAPDALAILVQKKNTLRSQGNERFILNSLVLARAGQDEDALAFPLQELTTHGYRRGIYHWRLSEVRDQVRDGLYPWACPFNGTFIPARVVTEVGLPNPEFFIWGEERDFLWRIARHFSIFVAVDSKVFHPKPRSVGLDWKHYYSIRNAILVNRHFRWTTVRNVRLIFLSLVQGARQGRAGLTLVLRAIGDGLRGRLGRREEYHP
jgi:rhamnopyranosyl-N-acetylglucosaminyl-diphospho-decaprenol beta-1,3/1,4-galactofuranosyltransferase